MQLVTFKIGIPHCRNSDGVPSYFFMGCLFILGVWSSGLYLRSPCWIPGQRVLLLVAMEAKFHKLQFRMFALSQSIAEQHFCKSWGLLNKLPLRICGYAVGEQHFFKKWWICSCRSPSLKLRSCDCGYYKICACSLLTGSQVRASFHIFFPRSRPFFSQYLSGSAGIRTFSPEPNLTI